MDINRAIPIERSHPHPYPYLSPLVETRQSINLSPLIERNVTHSNELIPSSSEHNSNTLSSPSSPSLIPLIDALSDLEPSTSSIQEDNRQNERNHTHISTRTQRHSFFLNLHHFLHYRLNHFIPILHRLSHRHQQSVLSSSISPLSNPTPLTRPTPLFRIRPRTPQRRNPFIRSCFFCIDLRAGSIVLTGASAVSHLFYSFLFL